MDGEGLTDRGSAVGFRFLYDLPSSLVRPSCEVQHNYHLEASLPRFLTLSPALTNDGNEADYFVVPAAPYCQQTETDMQVAAPSPPCLTFCPSALARWRKSWRRESSCTMHNAPFAVWPHADARGSSQWQVYTEAVVRNLQSWPWWERKGGADHVWVFSSDHG
jgi:hypothetical protein